MMGNLLWRACFPKDTKAFLKYSEENNSVLKLLERVIEINNKIRSSYSDLDEREGAKCQIFINLKKFL